MGRHRQEISLPLQKIHNMKNSLPEIDIYKYVSATFDVDIIFTKKIELNV